MVKDIIITMKDAAVVVWKDAEWDSEHYDGKCLLIRKDGKTIAIYNMDCVLSVIFR